MRGDHNSVSESVIGKVQAEQRKHPQLCKVINHIKKANLPKTLEILIRLFVGLVRTTL